MHKAMIQAVNGKIKSKTLIETTILDYVNRDFPTVAKSFNRQLCSLD